MTFVGVLLYTSAIAQIEHVSIGYGPMTFPVLPGNTDTTNGGVAYLSVGGEKAGGTIFIGGDSRITYGDETYGSGAVGLAAYNTWDFGVEDFYFGVFVGGMVIETWEKTDLTQGQFIDPNPFPTLKINKTNFQPYGGIKMGYKFIELQYAPVSNTVTFGFKLL